MAMTQFAMVEELAFLIKDNLYSKHLVLSTEQILIDFLQNDSSPDAVLDLEPMSSYHRLLVHRLADIFGFSHESVGEGDDRHIVLERCPESSIPSVLVSDILCQYDEYQPPTTTQHILRRKDVFPDMKTTRTAQPSAPLEERELAYEAARERIFSLHETDAKEPVTTKPRNVPVVARRMIAHALGQRISSNSHFHEASPLKSNESGSTEELNQKIEMDGTPNNVGKQSNGLSTQNLALDENRGKVIGQSTGDFTSQVDKKMHNKMLTSPSNKEVCSRSNGRVVGIDSIEKQHHGAAKRMFAHALGLPPSKGDHGGGVLKCNEASKVSNSFGRWEQEGRI